jgi:hypothetical protein
MDIEIQIEQFSGEYLQIPTQGKGRNIATALHIKTTVQPGGKIEVSSPELPEGKHVSVFVVVEEEEPSEKPHVLDIIPRFQGHRVFKTAEEVDEYIREERASWER